MNYLTPKEKLKIVLDLCKKLGITAYNIGENTPLNASGVRRILNKTVRPQSKTIHILYDYVIKREMEANNKTLEKVPESTSEAEEPETDYKNSIQEMVAQQVIKDLSPMLKQIIAQQQQNNRILIKNSLNIDDLKDEIEIMKKSLFKVHEVVTPKK